MIEKNEHSEFCFLYLGIYEFPKVKLGTRFCFLSNLAFSIEFDFCTREEKNA